MVYFWNESMVCRIFNEAATGREMKIWYKHKYD